MGISKNGGCPKVTCQWNHDDKQWGTWTCVKHQHPEAFVERRKQMLEETAAWRMLEGNLWRFSQVLFGSPVGTCWDLVGSLRMRSTRFLHATSCHSGGYWDRFSLGFLSSYLKERLRAFARGSADHAKQHRCDPMVCNLGHWGTQDFVLLFISFCGHVFPI